MTAGLLRAAAWARRWAATSEFACRGQVEWPLSRLEQMFSREEMAAVQAHYGAIALHALARALQSEADHQARADAADVTRPDLELDDPTPVVDCLGVSG